MITRIGVLDPNAASFLSRPLLKLAVQDILQNRAHCLILSGPQGSGKTSVVLAYVELGCDFYDKIIILNGDDYQNNCQAALIALGSASTTVADLCQLLEGSTEKWLLILDNVSAVQLKQLPLTSASHHIVATSREKPPLAHVSEMPPLSSQELLELFFIESAIKKSDDIDFEQLIIRICKMLGEYPKPVAEVARYLRKQLGILHDRAIDFFHGFNDFFPSNTFELSICASIANMLTQFQQLASTQQDEKIAYDLLCAICHLQAAFIPHVLVLKLFPQHNAVTMARVVELLYQKGILDKAPVSYDAHIANPTTLFALRYYFSQTPSNSW